MTPPLIVLPDNTAKPWSHLARWRWLNPSQVQVAITVFTKTPAEHLELEGEGVADGLRTRAIQSEVLEEGCEEVVG